MERRVLCTMNTDQTIRVSIGTAAVLGLTNICCDVFPTTAYLLTTGRCMSRCAFCAQGKSSNTREGFLSRVSWPEFPVNQVFKALSKGTADLQRICIQATSSPGIRGVVRKLAGDIAEIKKAYGYKYNISLSYRPSSIDDMESLFSLGVDRIGIALDAATEKIYKKRKAGSGSWESTMNLLRESSEIFPGRISSHLIVGLGETEEELIETMQILKDFGIVIGLFAFTPIEGTPMEHTPQPQLDSYRRVQIARHLITKGYSAASDFECINGRISRINMSAEDLKRIMSSGVAFETSGCPGCNRPFYNERPGGVMYNYPRPLTEDEVYNCLSESGLG